VRSHEAGGAQLVPDTFLHILTLLKAIARSRPSNIVTFAETHPITGPESKFCCASAAYIAFNVLYYKLYVYSMHFVRWEWPDE
jgi:hypothetical protein